MNICTKHVPDTANALVSVNADAMFDSPIAKQEGWSAQREDRFSAGLTSLPPKASKMVLAANVGVDIMQTTWEVAVVEMESQTLMSTLARRFQGSLGEINEIPTVRLPDDSFVVEFSDGRLGAIAPGNRQQVTRWLNEVNHSPSAYLEQGIHYANTNAQVIMLLDFEGAFAAHELDLDKFESVQNSKVDKAELNKLIASVKGVMLGIAFRDKAYAKLKIDFDEDAALISDMAKPLMLDIIGSYGVMLNELSDWEAEVKGKTVFLGGELTYHGLTRLASLTRLPTSALQHTDAADLAIKPAATDTAATGMAAPDTAATAPAAPAQPTPLETTQKYYTSVSHLLENLRSKKDDVQTMGQPAQWFENYGRHVDQLPTLGVDKEMLAYGAYVSQQLHGASMGLKGTTIQKAVDENQARNSSKIYGGLLGNVSQDNWQQSYMGYYGGMMGGNYGRRMETNAAYGMAKRMGPGFAMNSILRNEQQAATAVDIQARASAAGNVQEIVQNIEKATTQIRQAMTEKYQVQF